MPRSRSALTVGSTWVSATAKVARRLTAECALRDSKSDRSSDLLTVAVPNFADDNARWHICQYGGFPPSSRRRPGQRQCRDNCGRAGACYIENFRAKVGRCCDPERLNSDIPFPRGDQRIYRSQTFEGAIRPASSSACSFSMATVSNSASCWFGPYEGEGRIVVGMVNLGIEKHGTPATFAFGRIAASSSRLTTPLS